MLELKKYYNDKYDHLEVDVEEEVMGQILKPKKRLKAKRYLLMAAALTLLFGCAVVFTQNFMGPDGELLWTMTHDGSVLAYYDKVNEIEASMDLEEGDILHILVRENNPDEILTTRQEPWEVDYKEANRLTESLYNLSIDQAYYGFDYKNSHVATNLKTDKTNEIQAEMREAFLVEGEVIRTEKASYQDVVSLNHHYIKGEDELMITINPWLGNAVNFYGLMEKGAKKITVNGYEGLLKNLMEKKQFLLIKDETYYALTYTKGALSEEELLKILETIMK